MTYPLAVNANAIKTSEHTITRLIVIPKRRFSIKMIQVQKKSARLSVHFMMRDEIHSFSLVLDSPECIVSIQQTVDP